MSKIRCFYPRVVAGFGERKEKGAFALLADVVLEGHAVLPCSGRISKTARYWGHLIDAQAREFWSHRILAE